MNIKDFVSSFASQFEENDAYLISASTHFKELDEWSSLMALNIVAMIDEEYEVNIKGNDIRNALTVADLFDIVEVKKNV